jgi:hypothetical protein
MPAKRKKASITEPSITEPSITEPSITDTDDTITPDEPRAKKRGRKPRGGKIVATEADGLAVSVPEPNIILHLQCGTEDLQQKAFSRIGGHIESTGNTAEYGDSTSYGIIKESKHNNYFQEDKTTNESNRTIWTKIEELAIALHTNNISDKKSACFWDTCDFDSPPVYIPKFTSGGTYYCYGCFCSPECATAYLFREAIDTATRFERYALLNHLYCKIYDYNKNVKPAPDPFHTLDKFYGNLSIQEYRQHLKSERILLVVDKPLTRMLPELHDDNNEFVLNTKAVSTCGSFKLRRGRQKLTKTEMLAENFNMR